MKIPVKSLPFPEAMALPRPEHIPPKRPDLFFRTLVRLAAIPDLMATRFSYTRRDMEKAGEGPWLILMNHSSFIDLEIASRILYPKPYCIVCTSDGFVGKEWLMRRLGCIPTTKFVTRVDLIGDMRHALEEEKSSVLMYPEASYSFDGTSTPLPRKMGILLKRLGVPVVMISTEGAFTRDPLYNCLQKRKVRVSAEVRCLFSREELAEKSVPELDKALDEAFSFDYFAWQKEHHVRVPEPFRADGLERILYKCPACLTEGETEGKGVTLTCRHCGKTWTLGEYGDLTAEDGKTEFAHIPDWYAWERSETAKEVSSPDYASETEVDILVLADYNAIYKVGSGVLRHDRNGFTLTGCDGALRYSQSPLASYSLYSDYFWYELGDMVCIGDENTLYYCFPKGNYPVAKARLAAEELYRLGRTRRKND